MGKHIINIEGLTAKQSIQIIETLNQENLLESEDIKFSIIHSDTQLQGASDNLVRVPEKTTRQSPPPKEKQSQPQNNKKKKGQVRPNRPISFGGPDRQPGGRG